MPLILFIAAAIHLAQSQPDTTGLEHYVFVKRGEEGGRLYVLVQLEDLEDTLKPIFDAILDEPWLPVNQRYLKLHRSDYEGFYPEESSTRKSRIRKGWLAHEGVEVETSEGRIWVHKQDYELAQRAGEIAAAAYADEAQPTAAPPEPTQEGDAAPLGFWAEWGMHIAIVTAALALSAVVIWATLVRGPWRPLKP
ncbi:MAG: hypothetical protein QGD90_06090 [Candidatus Hydrogenedentes bacterium]|nr:hypothetical protein [Candidatus Hydrogenedentota bacterium]